jgi:vacuolar iron transporter family protein
VTLPPAVRSIEEMTIPGHDHDEHHRSHRTGWLRAGVLGANDGLLSTSSLLIGVAAGQSSRSAIALTGIAALGAGSLAMAAGEYGSVASQRDAEHADLAQERSALRTNSDGELIELQHIYIERGLPADLARTVAEHLHKHDALAAHARDELGLDPDVLARPLQAAVTSAVSFAGGALLPLVAILVAGARIRVAVTVAITIVALGALGALAASLGGAPKMKAVIRIVTLGALSMGVTAVIGRIAGANL